jgi:hypothetical protein
MDKVLFLFLLLAAFLHGKGGQAQSSRLPIGSWQLHVPHNRAIALAQAGKFIYTATEDGFFRLNQEYNQVQVLSKTDGFSGGKISTLDYDPASATLVIAYDNTNIDLVLADQITPLPDIFRKNIPGLKQIYHIYFQDKVAYLSCSFGLVLVDLVKQEIKETYTNLGPSGQVLQVYASTILHDSLYLATSNGLMAARRSNNNLLDYRNWKTFTATDGLPAANPQDFKSLATFNNKVYAGVNGQAIYRFNGLSWSPTPILLAGKTAWQVKGTAAFLQVVDGEKIILLDKSGTTSIQDGPQLVQPRAALQEPAGFFWVADYSQGLVKLTGEQTESFFPNGPMFNSAFRVYSDNKQVFVLGGGYDQAYEQSNRSTGFFVLDNGQWQSFNSSLYGDASQFPALQDLVGVVRSPVNQKLYFAGYGSGLLEWEGLGRFKVYNPDNSPLLTALAGNNAYTRIPALAVDAAGNIWMTNRHQQADAPGLHVLKTDGSWQSFRFPGFADGGNLEKIILDHNDFKWITVSRKPDESVRGLVVFHERTGQYRHLSSHPGAGNLPGPDIYALALDKNGPVWVGTDKGLAVFYEPERVFESGSFLAERPLIGGRPVLANQAIKAIAVDGGNRKWVGTDTGLWLFSEAADQVIFHFTTANSPLPSDNILDIGIHQGTGEVFVVTAAGLVSYRGTATVTAGKPDCAQVFPNPVRPGFTGQVGLSGLPQDALVKITDITGALVFETKAMGGMVAWDLKDLKGRRVKSGVYLAFSASPDGRQSCLSKIAVIN